MGRLICGILVLGATLSQIGCDAAGSAPAEESFRKVQLGMSEEEVTGILGKPQKAITHPQMKSLRMLEWGEDSRVVLENGHVDAVVLHDETILEKESEVKISEAE